VRGNSHAGFCESRRLRFASGHSPDAEVSRLPVDLHRQGRLGHEQLGARSSLDFSNRHPRGQFDEHQALRAHVDHSQVGDDPIDHSLAGERQRALLNLNPLHVSDPE